MQPGLLSCCALVVFFGATGAVEDDTWRVEFSVDFLGGLKGNRGTFIIEVHPEWAPLGAERFKELCALDFYKGVKVHRFHKGGFAQFGVSPDPQVTKYWDDQKLKDDPVLHSNKRGFVSFAMEDKHHRTTEILINMHNNPLFDRHGFAPFGALVAGHTTINDFYNIGDECDWDEAREKGDTYLSGFPHLTVITGTRILGKDEVV